jgi:CheY-like chemotaxis protein
LKTNRTFTKCCWQCSKCEDVDRGRFKGELPELALLDIRLPGEIKGQMVGERLRKSPILGQIAIVMSTAFKLSTDEERQMMSQAGADKLVYKPLPKFNELQRMLEEVIALRRAKSKPQAVDGKTGTSSNSNSK